MDEKASLDDSEAAMAPQTPDDVRAKDRALVARARNGDASSFEQLVKRHYLKVYGLAYRLCGQREDAQDVAQEAFVKAAASIRQFRGESAFTTWLYRITVNVATDHRRQRHRQYEAKQKFASEQMILNGHAEGRDEVWMALQRLPPLERDAVVLTVVEDLSHAEAAKVLGCAETTVSWRIFMAKQTLKKWLQGRGDHGR